MAAAMRKIADAWKAIYIAAVLSFFRTPYKEATKRKSTKHRHTLRSELNLKMDGQNLGVPLNRGAQKLGCTKTSQLKREFRMKPATDKRNTKTKLRKIYPIFFQNYVNFGPETANITCNSMARGV